MLLDPQAVNAINQLTQAIKHLSVAINMKNPAIKKKMITPLIKNDDELNGILEEVEMYRRKKINESRRPK